MTQTDVVRCHINTEWILQAHKSITDHTCYSVCMFAQVWPVIRIPGKNSLRVWIWKFLEPNLANWKFMETERFCPNLNLTFLLELDLLLKRRLSDLALLGTPAPNWPDMSYSFFIFIWLWTPKNRTESQNISLKLLKHKIIGFFCEILSLSRHLLTPPRSVGYDRSKIWHYFIFRI